MSIAELVIELNKIAPTYYMFPIADDNNPSPTLPFISYVPSKDYIFADNMNYNSNDTFTLEYYFKFKNPTNEQSLETKLNELGFTFERSEDTRIEDMFVIYYYI